MAQRSLAESLYVICREASRLPWICVSVLRDDEHGGAPDLSRESREPVLVLGGFLSHPYLYAPLGRALTRKGYGVHYDEAFNVKPFKMHLLALGARVAAIAEACGSPVHIVGHSLGGIHAMALLVDRPEAVGRVVAVASPIAGGTPWRPLQRLAERVLRVRAREARGLLRRLAPHVTRLTTVCLPEDAIAPPAACAVEGARNRVLTDVAACDRALVTHGGVVFMRTAVKAVLDALEGAPAAEPALPVAV